MHISIFSQWVAVFLSRDLLAGRITPWVKYSSIMYGGTKLYMVERITLSQTTRQFGFSIVGEIPSK